MKYLSIIMLVIILLACNQAAPIKNLEGLDIPTINKHLKATPWELKPSDIIELYYNKEARDSADGTETITINTNGSSDMTTTVMLIHDNLLDGTSKANRITMVMKPKGEQWNVISIDKHWKCWRDTEEEDWKSTPCT